MHDLRRRDAFADGGQSRTRVPGILNRGTDCGPVTSREHWMDWVPAFGMLNGGGIRVPTAVTPSHGGDRQS